MSKGYNLQNNFIIIIILLGILSCSKKNETKLINMAKF